jgi:hypothetical protein
MKKISFIPMNSTVVSIINPPVLASKHLPDWYQKQNAIIGDKICLSETGNPNTTIKKCMPVLDDMSAGYFILTPADIIVSYDYNIGMHSFSWSLEINNDTAPSIPPIISTHSTEQISHLPVPENYSVHPFKFQNYYRIVTPEGYSCLFRHPSWRFDLPYYTLSGLVDTDSHPVPINFPFLIKNNWEGIIPEGTPIVQVIPFRRTEWVSEVVGDNNEEGAMQYRKSTKKILHRYKDNWRSIKIWK